MFQDKAKSLNKTKAPDLSKKELPGLYINISTENDPQKLKTKSKGSIYYFTLILCSNVNIF